jgi:AP-1 complex subunit beta-1
MTKRFRNYAKSHPDLCILAVNTFVQDSEDPNPLIRALAIRTMGCIRVDKMVDYMEEPLRKTLRDESPYVRKTAALCVAKLFDLAPEMCMENGFLEQLQELVGDPNPMVVANSVTALVEMQEAAPESKALIITPAILKKMLLALNECTEWGRVTLLTTLADYKAADVKEAEHICERVVPQFQHVNPSVVLAAVKVVFLHMKYISPEMMKSYTKKMAPPLGMFCLTIHSRVSANFWQSHSYHPHMRCSMSLYGISISCSRSNRRFSARKCVSSSASTTTQIT